MKLILELKHIEGLSTSRQPIVLTIGNFDGMHRGHKVVLEKAKNIAGLGQTIVITFSNHPSTILRPSEVTALLCSISHRTLLIEKMNVHTLILLPFTRYLARHTAAHFIEYLRQFIPFTDLVLGHDATLGRDKGGNRSMMESLGEIWGFNLHYIPEYRFEGQLISSTYIREFVRRGDLTSVERLLERPYSIYGPVLRGKGKGRELGYPTINIDVETLCLPPLGVYIVEIHQNGRKWQGIANLGKAPTVKQDGKIFLEVHIFSFSEDVVGQCFEIIFKQFIRPEIAFKDVEELKKQIENDVKQAKIFFESISI